MLSVNGAVYQAFGPTKNIYAYSHCVQSFK